MYRAWKAGNVDMFMTFLEGVLRQFGSGVIFIKLGSYKKVVIKTASRKYYSRVVSFFLKSRLTECEMIKANKLMTRPDGVRVCYSSMYSKEWELFVVVWFVVDKNDDYFPPQAPKGSYSFVIRKISLKKEKYHNNHIIPKVGLYDLQSFYKNYIVLDYSSKTIRDKDIRLIKIEQDV